MTETGLFTLSSAVHIQWLMMMGVVAKLKVERVATVGPLTSYVSSRHGYALLFDSNDTANGTALALDLQKT